MSLITSSDVKRVSDGYGSDPANSQSLNAEAYIDQKWFDAEIKSVFSKTWQWVCHIEKLREPGNYIAVEIAGTPIVVVRNREGELRAFYNVCKHRAHELVTGSGTTKNLVCPYHAWTFGLNGELKAARRADQMENFDKGTICLDKVQVEEFCGFVYVNLDGTAKPLAEQAGDLKREIEYWAPGVEKLTLAKRLTYEINSNWKNVIDNFLECYHCHIAHPEFVDLVDMGTYIVKTYGIWSSHFAEAGKSKNVAYDVEDASVTTHAVWWLWPNTCLLRYPGRNNFMILQIIPAGPEKTLEIWDFYLEDNNLTKGEVEAVNYINDVLQVQDIAIVESVQKGMKTPAFNQGRLVFDPDTALSEHGVHHFHGLLIDSYRSMANE